MDRPLTWHKHVHRDKLTGGRLACTKCMKGHSLFTIFFHNILYQLLFTLWQGRIHQTSHGAIHKLNTCPNDVESYCHCDQWINDPPARKSCNSNTTDYAGGSPYICHEMMRVGFEGD